jgi:phage gp45-like
MLNAVPEQYVQFSTAGIRVHSPTQIKLDAPDILLEAQTVEINASTSTTVTPTIFTVNGNAKINGVTTLNGAVGQTGGGAATFSGSMAVTGDVTAQGTSVHTHTHGGVQPGGGSTGAPN